MIIKTIIAGLMVFLLLGCQPIDIDGGAKNIVLPTFSTCRDLNKAFENANEQGIGPRIYKGGVMMDVAEGSVAPVANGADRDYSETNIQVEGVDEADIIKTDGNYVYAIANNRLIIAKAYPAEAAKILYEGNIANFTANEIFIDRDRLLIFGETYNQQIYPIPLAKPGFAERIMAYPMGYSSLTTAKLYDIGDKGDPELLRSIDLEGNYVSSRKIGEYVYFVVNTYPNYVLKEQGGDIVPLYKDTEVSSEFKPVAGCADISYIPPVQAASFITVVGMSIRDENADLNKETVVGNGQNVYASLSNLYIVQSKDSMYFWDSNSPNKEVEKSVIAKFEMDNGKIRYQGTGEVLGHVLNQFSIDEYNGNFRIATTISGYSDNKDTSTNNLYILDGDLKVIGGLEEVAPGESIYSVRFIGERAYLVTFKQVDPLFVIDLSDPTNPTILGKLKIPGYSDYLHPYDETHLIGIGKEVDESIDADKVHTEGAVYYTAIQGVKLAIFDVSDVSNPIEMYKEVIGDRGTESEATSNHKAFLFDKEKGLLILPMTVVELRPGQSKGDQGEYTFQGAYVYDISLENGFELRGRVSHYDNDDDFKKSGNYFYGESSILRSFYIEDVLYTFSNKRIQLNDLNSLETLKRLDLKQEEQYSHYGYDGVLL